MVPPWSKSTRKRSQDQTWPESTEMSLVNSSPFWAEKLCVSSGRLIATLRVASKVKRMLAPGGRTPSWPSVSTQILRRILHVQLHQWVASQTGKMEQSTGNGL